MDINLSRLLTELHTLEDGDLFQFYREVQGVTFEKAPVVPCPACAS